MDILHRIGPLLGRLLIAQIFLMSGIGKITGFEGTAGYIASKGLPLPQLLAAGSILLELGGGLLLIIGWKTRWAAAALLAFTLLAALFFHNYWAVPAEQAQDQMIHFMKNLAMAGGILYVIAYGGGPLSLDERRSGGGTA
ncbi:MAG: DoxX family protein [Pseudomonadota bacterium]